MTFLEFNKNEIIFKQGDYAPVMYDILSGSVGIYTAYGSKNEKELTILKEGQILGEMGLIEAYPRSATAVALEDGTKLHEIDEKELCEYFSDQPERVLLIMRQLSQRLRERTEDYQQALEVLNEIKEEKGIVDKHSTSFLDRIKVFFDFYNDTFPD